MDDQSSDQSSDEWREAEAAGDDDEDVQIEEYDLASSPNDFNTLTIVNFIESGAVKIPGFQRNYVWDIKRASKLIESLILGLPVPQVFLYEQSRNEFLVIDGQQRLLTIYFFVNQRIPRKNKRAELRRILAVDQRMPTELLHDDEYFENFALRLPDVAEGTPNKFSRLKYETLGDYRTQFDLRTIRNIIVKQLRPTGDDSSVYEIFHRLNSGGVNLRPQEIRGSLYYSSFFEMLADVNLDDEWRDLIGLPDLDLNLGDVEVLLRAVAMLQLGDSYSPSMVKFLNKFAKQAKTKTKTEIESTKADLLQFVRSAHEQLPERSFSRSNKFSVTLFESAFRAAVLLRRAGYDESDVFARIPLLRDDKQFLEYSTARSSNRANVKGRLSRAYEIMAG